MSYEQREKIIDITRAQLITLRNNGDLIPSWVYHITDRDIYLEALEEDVIGTQGRRRMRVPLTTFYTPQIVSLAFNFNYIGIYGQGIAAGSVPNSGTFIGATIYYAIWGGRMWERNTSGADGAPPNDFELNSTGWTLVPDTDDVRYETKYFGVEYDLDADDILVQTDWKGNTVINSVVSTFDTVTHTDWNNDLIVNNRTQGIYNNWRNSTTRATIINNNVKGIIWFNRNNGDIINNNCLFINNNTNNGDIANNIINKPLLNATIGDYSIKQIKSPGTSTGNGGITTPQDWFPSDPSFDLQPNRQYHFKGFITMQGQGSTSHAIQIGFGASGGMISSLTYITNGNKRIQNIASTTSHSTFRTNISMVTTTPINITNGGMVEIQGTINTLGGGQLSPKYSFSSVPGSLIFNHIGYFEIEEI